VSAAGQSFESQGAPVVTDGTWAVEPYEGQPVLVLSVNGEKVAGLPFEGDGDAVRIAGQVYRRSAL
jgi:hypothetical protein